MKAIVLAAGKGVRMKSDLPKVVHKINGKSLISHVCENLKQAGVDQIICVVGYKAELVQEELGDTVSYAVQEEQLGTGHAVLQAENLLKDFDGYVVVACGDAPFISSKSFKSLNACITGDDAVKGVVLTAVYDNPFGYGRIVKNDDGSVGSIVEEKDADEGIRKITEVNTGTYIFDSKLLFESLKKIDTNNAQNEYYLPDAVQYINEKGFKFLSVVLEDNREGTGINTLDELERASELFV